MPKKTTVEDSRGISITKLRREGLLEPGTAGIISWRCEFPKSEESVEFDVETDSGIRFLHLRYRVGKQPVNMEIRLTTTPLHHGGERWWFVCPLITDGTPCNRRVGKLYAPPGEKYFGCRHCYDLSYQSRQKYDKRYRDPFAQWRRRK